MMQRLQKLESMLETAMEQSQGQGQHQGLSQPVSPVRVSGAAGSVRHPPELEPAHASVSASEGYVSQFRGLSDSVPAGAQLPPSIIVGGAPSANSVSSTSVSADRGAAASPLNRQLALSPASVSVASASVGGDDDSSVALAGGVASDLAV